MFKYSIIPILFVFLLVGCSSQNQTLTPEKIGEQYLQDQNYTIVSHEKSFEPYTLTKNDLSKTENAQIWQVQTVNADDFIGKKIYGEKFIVKNHPLDNWQSDNSISLGETQVYLMIVNDKVIGGTSFPVTKEAIYGSPYSLDGKTFEKIHPNENWKDWTNRWSEKYK